MLNLSRLPTARHLASSTRRLPASQVSRILVRPYSQAPGGQEERAPGVKEREHDASRHAPPRDAPRARGGIPTTGSPVVDAAATALIGLGAGESVVR